MDTVERLERISYYRGAEEPRRKSGDGVDGKGKARGGSGTVDEIRGWMAAFTPCLGAALVRAIPDREAV
jgi:hypothetical protein